jgi:hypothetical protein
VHIDLLSKLEEDLRSCSEQFISLLSTKQTANSKQQTTVILSMGEADLLLVLATAQSHSAIRDQQATGEEAKSHT